MRQRYLLVAHPGRELPPKLVDRLTHRTGLQRALQCSEFSLLVSDPADVLALPGESGAVIGKLFHRHGPPRQLRAFPIDAVHGFNDGVEQHLIERYWGGYIAVRVGAGCLNVLRDPSGMLACYYTQAEGVVAFASDAPLLVDAELVVSNIDWDSVGRILFEHDLPRQESAIHGIRQVRPGFALAIGPDGIDDQEYWSPWRHVTKEESSPAEKNIEALGRTVRQVISAWASCYSRALVGISGGLDSSIVALCLAEAKANVSCVTLITDDLIGDEREYARTISASIGAELLEERYSLANIDLRRSVAADIPCPFGKIHEEAYNSVIRQAAHRQDADAIFTGVGGDSVFYLTHSARPLADRYLQNGWSLGLWETAKDLSTITGASLWQVIQEARRVYKARHLGIKWHLFPDFLDPEFVAAQRQRGVSHPWLDPSGEMPPGKQGHLATLLRALNHMEHRDKALCVPVISPLMSQPVLELVLKIPSWETCHGGVDRAVARQAFARTLPRKIVGRHGKGGPDGFVAQVIQRHRPAIREQLLEGNLAEHGLVDRNAINAGLRPGARLRAQDYPRIMALLDAEAWTNAWRNRAASSAPTPAATLS